MSSWLKTPDVQRKILCLRCHEQNKQTIFSYLTPTLVVIESRLKPHFPLFKHLPQMTIFVLCSRCLFSRLCVFLIMIFNFLLFKPSNSEACFLLNYLFPGIVFFLAFVCGFINSYSFFVSFLSWIFLDFISTIFIEATEANNSLGNEILRERERVSQREHLKWKQFVQLLEFCYYQIRSKY